MAGPGVAPGGPLDLLERCGACGQRLRANRDPRLLPCLHSVCGTCLRGEGEAAVSCPVCRQQCPLSEVVANYFLMEPATSSPAGGQCCTSCEDNAAASEFCEDCWEPLCDTCVEAHQRVRMTRDHALRPAGGGRSRSGNRVPSCPEHQQERLELFCTSCEQLTCRHCQLQAHRHHQCQLLEDAVREQRKLLLALVKRLGDQHSQLQRSTKEVRGFIRQVSDRQKRLQVEVKMAILQIMKELNKRGRVLLSDAQKVAEGQQEQLEQQHWALTELQRQQEHVLRFTSWALGSDNSTALLLSRKLLHSQLHQSLKPLVAPVEPQGALQFHWDPQAWTKSAETFGTIISEQSSVPVTPSPQPSAPSSAAGTLQAAPAPPSVVTAGLCDPSPLLLTPPIPSPIQPGAPTEGQEAGTPKTPPHNGGGKRGSPNLPQGSSPTQRSPRAVATELATTPSRAAATRAKRKRSSDPSGEEDNVVRKPQVKRSSPAEAAVGSPLLRRVPRVSLERLDLDLSSSSQPPVFRVFPGSSAQDFSLIVIERGAQPPAPPRIKEEPQEAPISTSNPRRFRQLPELPGGGGAGSTGSSCLGSGSDLPAPPLPAPIPAVSCCRVCGQAGAVVMCDCCERCYHLQCHLPALHEVPSPDWRCLLCQELPPGGQDPPTHPPQRLSPAEQRRCEFVLLELLCHEPCRPLQHLSSCLDGVGALDLTLIRARLQGKVGAPYSRPEDFASDVCAMIHQFNRLTEDKADVQSILGLHQFFQSRLSAAFGDHKFPPSLLLLLSPHSPPCNPKTPPEPHPGPQNPHLGP